jgi:hypothetical protein
VSSIIDDKKRWDYPFDGRWQQLYDALIGIQTATREDPFGWLYEISR